MTNDFDAARREADASAAPVTFTAFGREWTLARLSSSLLRDYLVPPRGQTVAQGWLLMDELIDNFVTDDVEAWRDLVAHGRPAKPAVKAAKNRKAEPAQEGFEPFSIADKKDLILWAYRQETGRPTGRFANS